MGFRFTGTRGITSALTSRLGPDLLQTDAPINGGNSGGPLISLESGIIVGINAAKISDEEVEGIGLAVPIPFACRILDLMRRGKDPSPPDALVDFVVDDGGERTLVVARSRLPAGAPALIPGDEIVGVNGKPASTQTQLFNALRGESASSLQVKRGDKVRDVTGTWPQAALITKRTGVVLAGALIAPVSDEVSRLPIDNLTLMVHSVARGSEAESIDLQAYDLLVAANGQTVRSLTDLQTISDAAHEAGRPLELSLLRLLGDNELVAYQRRYLDIDMVQTVGPTITAENIAQASPAVTR